MQTAILTNNSQWFTLPFAHKLRCNAVEATKYICGAKDEGTWYSNQTVQEILLSLQEPQ